MGTATVHRCLQCWHCITLVVDSCIALRHFIYALAKYILNLQGCSLCELLSNQSVPYFFFDAEKVSEVLCLTDSIT